MKQLFIQDVNILEIKNALVIKNFEKVILKNLNIKDFNQIFIGDVI